MYFEAIIGRMIKNDGQVNKSKAITIRMIVWIVLSLIFFLSESLTNLIAPDLHEVTIWLTVMFTGLVLILIGVSNTPDKMAKKEMAYGYTLKKTI